MKFYKNKKKIELQVGIFTIAALIILVFSYTWLTGWLEKKDYTPLRVKFPMIQSVEKGTPVTILGVHKGKVNALEVEEDGIIMHLLLELDFPLRSGTRFYVKENSIMGDVSVEIEPGRGEEILDLNTALRGESGYSISGLIKNFSHLTLKLDSFLDEMDFEANWGNKINTILDSTQHFIHSINEITKQNSTKINSIIQNAETITNEMQDFTKNHKQTIEQTVDKTATSVDLLETNLISMQESIKNMNEITRKMAEEESDFQEFISDRKLYEKMLETTSKIDSLLIDIKENPKRYFQIKIF